MVNIQYMDSMGMQMKYDDRDVGEFFWILSLILLVSVHNMKMQSISLSHHINNILNNISTQRKHAHPSLKVSQGFWGYRVWGFWLQKIPNLPTASSQGCQKFHDSNFVVSACWVFMQNNHLFPVNQESIFFKGRIIPSNVVPFFSVMLLIHKKMWWTN